MERYRSIVNKTPSTMERKRSIQQDGANRPGRREPSGAAAMQPAVTAALTRALFEEWARSGYAALSLEAVARRAGVGKAALYRRWPSKLAMVSDRLWQIGLEATPLPDTGSLEGDVTALLRSLRRGLRHPLARRIVPDLHAEMPRSPGLTTAVRRLQEARRRRGAELIARAVERGELRAGVDVELAGDVLGALIYWRMIVIGGRADRAYLTALTRTVLGALRAA